LYLPINLVLGWNIARNVFNSKTNMQLKYLYCCVNYNNSVVSTGVNIRPTTYVVIFRLERYQNQLHGFVNYTPSRSNRMSVHASSVRLETWFLTCAVQPWGECADSVRSENQLHSELFYIKQTMLVFIFRPPISHS
jgi:hypothetical protein